MPRLSPHNSINRDGHSFSQPSVPLSMCSWQPEPHQCCIGSFPITVAVRDTRWWIMALSGPHLGDVSLVFPVKCVGDYTQAQRQTQTLIRSERRQIGPQLFDAPTYGVLDMSKCCELYHHHTQVRVVRHTVLNHEGMCEQGGGEKDCRREANQSLQNAKFKNWSQTFLRSSWMSIANA